MKEELSEGFKCTELGPLPKEWDVVRLGKASDQRKETVNPREGKWKYVGLEHIEPGESRLKGFGSSDEVRSAKSKFYSGDVLYGKLRPYLDKGVLVDFEGICSTDIIVLKPKECLNEAFLSYLVHTDDFIEHAIKTMTGVNHPRTSWRALSQFSVPLPPMPEQMRIATVLSVVQETKEKTQEVTKGAKELKKSMLRHLFTYGPVPVKETDKVSLNETEIGLMPEHWEVARLNDVCAKVIDCPHTTPRFQTSGILVVKNLNVRDGRLILQPPFYTTEDEYLQRIKRCEPKEGDVLFSREAPIGEACLVPQNTRLSLGQRMMLIRTDSLRLHNYFLVQVFYSPNMKRIMQALASGVTAQHLNVADVRRLEIPLPPLPEQIEVARIIKAAARKIGAEENRKKTIEDLFRSLLHNLMIGRMRVDQPEVGT